MIVIGADHGGVELKEKVKAYLKNKNIECMDYGTFTTDSVDYPLIAEKVANDVASGKYPFGLLFCGTGIGMSIAANKVNGIRAVCCADIKTLKFTRTHNNANILCLGGRIIDESTAIELVETFLNTEFEGGRHQRRIDEISDIEKRN